MRVTASAEVESCCPPVLLVTGGSGGTSRYRCDHPAEQLAIYGIQSASVLSTDPTLRERAERSAVVVFHRVPGDRYIQTVIAEARKSGSLILCDTDDLVFEPSLLYWIGGMNQGARIELALRRLMMRELRDAIHCADGCIVSTEFLAERIRAIGHPAWVLRNAFSLEMLSYSEQARARRTTSREKLVIGYASGTPSHDKDFEVAAPALREILAQHREAELWIVGHLQLGAEWNVLDDRIRRLSPVPWQELPAILAQFDVNIAPLESGNPFCRAKSEVKWMEAALVGVPTVASRTDAFEHAIEQGKTGLLAASPDEWLDYLETLARDPDLRHKMGEQSREAALVSYPPAVRGRELIQTLNAIGELVHGRRLWPEPAMSTVAQWQPVPAYDTEVAVRAPALLRALHSLRNHGLLFFLLQSLVFILKHMPWRKRP